MCDSHATKFSCVELIQDSGNPFTVRPYGVQVVFEVKWVRTTLEANVIPVDKIISSCYKDLRVCGTGISIFTVTIVF